MPQATKWRNYNNFLNQGLWNSIYLNIAFQEFVQITKTLLHSRYKLNEDVSEDIADMVWNEIKTKDIRDVLQIAKLAHNIDDVQDVARTLMKYRPRPKTTDDE